MVNTLLVEVRVARQSSAANYHEQKLLIERLSELGFVLIKSDLSTYGEVIKLSIACPADSELVDMIAPTLHHYNRTTSNNSGLLIRFYSVSITSPHENIALGVASDKSQSLANLEATIEWISDTAKRNPPPLDNWYLPVQQPH